MILASSGILLSQTYFLPNDQRGRSEKGAQSAKPSEPTIEPSQENCIKLNIQEERTKTMYQFQKICKLHLMIFLYVGSGSVYDQEWLFFHHKSAIRVS